MIPAWIKGLTYCHQWQEIAQILGLAAPGDDLRQMIGPAILFSAAFVLQKRPGGFRPSGH
jgi:hypothetical protein